MWRQTVLATYSTSTLQSDHGAFIRKKKQTCFQDHLATLNMHLQWMVLKVKNVPISCILHKIQRTVKMKVACSSKMLVFIHHTTQSYIPQSYNLHSLSHQNLKFHIHMRFYEFYVFKIVHLMYTKNSSSKHKAVRVWSYLHQVLRLRMCRAVPPLPHVSSWDGDLLSMLTLNK